ncbi:hypothetical protein [Nostoc sp. DSM 114167]|jgi:lycopene cyclase CruP
MSLTEEILSQLPGDVLKGLRQGDRILTSVRENSVPTPQLVKEN